MRKFFFTSSRPNRNLQYIDFVCFIGLIALIGMMLGCDDSRNSLNVSSLEKFAGAVSSQWTSGDPLMPTGNSTQDTENLQAALVDSRMNEGGTLYLGPGTFYVHSSLVRQSFDDGDIGYSPDLFNGTIQGSGKGVTIIKSVRGPGDEPFTPFYGFPGTFLVWDFDYFGVKDLTFEADSEIADLWEFPGLLPTEGLLSYVNLGSSFYGVGGQYGTDCINVHFKGSFDSDGVPEIPLLWECFGGGGGVHNVKSCDFENSNFVMMDYGEWEGGTFNIGGSGADKNTYTNTSDLHVYAINTYSVGDCNVNVSHVEINNSGGYGFWPHPENSMSTVNVSNNVINMIPESWFAGVELWAIPGSGDVSAVVSNNKIHSEETFIFGPIFAEGLFDLLISNNKLTGNGPGAIYLGVFEEWAGSGTLIGNNVQQWATTPFDGLPVAPIWLGPNISNAVVVGGGNNNENVFDMGSDNSYTGVSNAHANIGQAVREAMQMRRAIRNH